MNDSALFPEPPRTEPPKRQPRYVIWDDANAYVDNYDTISEPQTAIRSGDSVTDLADTWYAALFATYEEACWLHDTLAGKWYEPMDWPEDDEVRSVELHRVALQGN